MFRILSSGFVPGIPAIVSDRHGSKPPEGDESGSANQSTQSANTGGRILIVEDEMLVALTLRGSLEQFGYTVTGVAASADDAVAQAIRDKPDLILMDIRLRGARDGVSAAEEIRKSSAVRIVFVTAHTDAATVARASRVDPVAFLGKPYGDAELMQVVVQALRRNELN